MMNEQIQKIRDLINKSPIQSPLLKNETLWNQLCSCLDVICDSELAVDAFLDRGVGKSVGEHYLAVYGLLQALFIQQDAVINLEDSLGIQDTVDNYPRLKEIRKIRNYSIGHPTKAVTKKQRSSHFISRPTLKLGGFQLLSFFSNGPFQGSKFADISIPDLIADQRTYLSEILTSVIGELGQKEKAHKEKFRMEKLASIFPATLSYDFGKVFEGTIKATIRREHAPLGTIGLQQIKQMLQSFREALAQRGTTYDSINYVYELLDYPLTELEAFFQNVWNVKELNINEKTAFIFAFFLQKQVDELISMAKEIDEDYSS